jgi:predicted alpha/beta-hydrolase family hydrolase
LGAAGVLSLAFPLHPPGKPASSRASELALATGRLLVVQGRRDPFGGPEEIEPVLPVGARLVAVDGDHGLRADVPAVVTATSGWLAELRAAAE